MDAPTSSKFAFAPIGTASALALLVGALAVHALPVLPARWIDAAIGAIGALAMLRPRLRLAGWLLLGFAWCAWRADIGLAARLPRELDGRDVDVTGAVVQLPLRREEGTRFVFAIDEARLAGAPIALRGLARIAWYDGAPDDLAACTRWQLHLRLRRPRGLVNRGGFDSERQALERGIVAVGYVRDDPGNRRLGLRAFCVDGLRETLAQGIAARVGDAHDAALLRAFAIGDTRGLDETDWSVARANGIPHLISISGFHVGVAAAFGALFVRLVWWLWPRFGAALPFPLAQAPAALLTAALYGALAGGSLPTVRTLGMIGVAALTRCTRRGGGGAHALALALFAVVVADPLATLAAGFWLSFAGVAFLMLCLARGRGLLAFLRELTLGQMVMTVSLLPLSLWFFGEASLVGALSNLIAVPLISFVIVPLCLLGILALLALPVLATPLLGAAAWLAHLQWRLLEIMATWPGAHGYLPEATPWAVVLAMLGAIWLFLPRAPARALGALLFLPLLCPERPVPAPGAFEAIVIDVGQGLSVFVRTHSHALLFDAGARYPSAFDLGEAAVLPTLHALGIERLDLFFVSHADNDHAGGAPVVAAAYPDAHRYSGEPQRLALASAQCREGQAWDWDGVQVRVLAPKPAAFADAARTSGNDRSCVVLVQGAGSRLLLTGDISRRVEADVAAAVGAGPLLAIVAPHHGSHSSSSAAFVDALEPTLALVSAGWRNRFGHPHADVVQRYRAAGAQVWNTADEGALQIAFPRAAPPQLIARERWRWRRYWRE